MLTLRVEKALTVQRRVCASNRDYMVKSLDVLHRLELALVDNLEFEFELALLSVEEYTFLHVFSGMCGQLGDSKAMQRITIPEFIAITEAAYDTLDRLVVKTEEYQYDPLQDDMLFAPMKRLPEMHQELYKLVPVVLTIAAPPDGDGSIRWKRDTIKTVMDVVQMGYTQLLKKGLGDRA